jgi:hypothetical protein
MAMHGPSLCAVSVLPQTAFLYHVGVRRPSAEELREYGEKFAADNLAYVDSEFVPQFDRTSVRRSRWGLLVWFGAMVPGPVMHLAGLRWLDPFAAACAGSALVGAVIAGLYLRAAGREFPPPPGRPVIARARHVRVSDYVPPVAVCLCIVACVVSVVIGVDAVRVAATADFDYARGSAIGTVIVAAVIAPIAAIAPLYMRIVCDRPESAVDQAHLYFQDAWRAQLMRGVLYGVLLGTAMLIALASVEVLPDALVPAMFPYGLVAAAGLGLLLHERSKLWFRKRLWSGLAPGQVIRPGEEVAV